MTERELNNFIADGAKVSRAWLAMNFDTNIEALVKAESEEAFEDEKAFLMEVIRIQLSHFNRVLGEVAQLDYHEVTA